MRLERLRQRLVERHTDAGFSIVEMAVTIAVFSIVMTVIFGTVINVVNASNSVRDRNQQEADTRLVIDTFVRELRQAYTGKATMDSVVMTASNAASITFYSPDRDPNFHLRKITYTRTAAGVLNRTVVSSAELNSVVGTTGAWTFGAGVAVPVLTGVTNTTLFTYVDQNNVVTTSGAALQAVLLDLVIDQTPGRSPAAQTYHTQVDLRVSS